MYKTKINSLNNKNQYRNKKIFSSEIKIKIKKIKFI